MYFTTVNSYSNLISVCDENEKYKIIVTGFNNALLIFYIFHVAYNAYVLNNSPS